ncbi:hypothetical protein ACFVFS_05795 [Kitasatospora sp. NPDC057692]|uniref:hypothetical protein n=1 Tax=Kitasatospora sp. NPDC057692 TaxID=3346215 RepID=UPI0036CBC378
MSRRAVAETAAAKTRLRDRIRELEDEVAEQGRANGRLARRTTVAENAVAGATVALTAGRRELLAENARLRAAVDQYRTANRGLCNQLDHALGYTAEEIAMLNAGVSTR